MLGDVGGLFGTLTIGGSIICAPYFLITGNQLDQFISENIFFIEKKKNPYVAENTFDQVNCLVKGRKSAVFKYSGCLARCLRKRKHEVLRELANDRVSKKLDLINFIRSHLITDVMRKILFTKDERFLLRRQADPFVLTTAHKKNSSSSDIDQSELKLNDSPFLYKLIKGLQSKSSRNSHDKEVPFQR